MRDEKQQIADVEVLKQRKVFHVTWAIEVDASTPEQAAREALEIMQDSGSVATCFDVDDKEGNKHFIDLHKRIDNFIYSPEDLIKSIRTHIESLTKADKNKLFTQIYDDMFPTNQE